MRRSQPIYVETTIDTDMETLWAHTQRPELHRQWDLRFSDIVYNHRERPVDPQTFTYTTSIGFGLRIAGTGETSSQISRKRNERLSTLTFGSQQPLSLISQGAGYWRYTGANKGSDTEPNTAGTGEQGITFVTQFDYRTRFGLAGQLLDRWLFRPMFGYATAWSFDCLRIWLERGVPPRVMLRQAIVHYTCMAVLACLWLYQGFIPKLMYPHSGELAIMQAVQWVPAGGEERWIKLLGAVEVGIGVATLMLRRSRSFLCLQLLLLVLLMILACVGSPALLLSPFNPVALGAAMMALAYAGMLSGYELPSAKRCLRTPTSNGGRLQ